jgi:hypothetical protein
MPPLPPQRRLRQSCRAVAIEPVARLAGLEPAAYGLEVRCSIQLSYRRNTSNGNAIIIANCRVSTEISMI